MDSVSVSFKNTEEQKPSFSLASDPHASTTSKLQDSFGFDSRNSGINHDGIMSSMTPLMHGLTGNELLNMLAQQEPRVADSAPSVAEMDMFTNMRYNGSEVLNDDASLTSNYFSGISSANNYLSLLTREQLSVLRSIRPSLLYEFLQEIAKARSDRRVRRHLPNECAFCKNNGENEECYSSHVLKDGRGRVLCPVLRAFRCPRCGATGDRAHTIKYCPEGSESGGLALRRRLQPSAGLLLNAAGFGGSRTQAPAAPAASPSPMPASSSLPYNWSNFTLN
ncbi:unnamed protein product [Chrysodeixis includens]|uniref:Nanos-type domain-containing protein n=1 Tax=Chrysodeixis includens TaxID=689277 RepID=A0A9N8L2T2_CHRIL|nr:unnamed protein product [Chrysodeixis includens]